MMDERKRPHPEAEGSPGNWVRSFEVASPRKHQNGFTVYRVTSVVFPKSTPEASTRVVVWKRFSDFKKLYENLKSYHQQWQIIEEMPPLCKGKYFKRFDENVIKARMDFALDLLNFIGRHQTLFTSEFFLQFFNNTHHLIENTPATDENPGIYLNENNVVATLNFSCEDERNNAFFWKSKEKKESLENNCECSDEDIISTSDTSDSVSSSNSLLSYSFSTDNFKNIDLNFALDYYVSHTFTSRKIKHQADPELLTRNTYLERHSPSNDICLSVRTEDFGTEIDDLTGENCKSWPVVPVTPPGKQNYLVDGAYYVGQAQKHEADRQFEAAFCFYKAAIACLLSGVQDDEVKSRSQAVREKIQQYLLRAKKIYALYLAPVRDPESSKFTRKAEELNAYKVIKVIDRVMLVLNISNQKYYVIKVLQKSSYPTNEKKKTIIPYRVPYMVKLLKYMENESSIFLVLEYISSGKLLDNIKKFSESQVGKVVEKNDFNYYYIQNTSKLTEATDKFISKYEATEIKSSQQRNGYSHKKPVPNMSSQSEFLPVKNKTSNLKNDCALMVSQLKKINVESLDVKNLVKNSQKLLNSVSETLEKSEKLTNNLSKELIDIEAVFDLKCSLLASKKIDLNFLEGKKMKNRSRSAGVRPKFERSHSTEELSESRARTASNSLDRRSEWSSVENAFPRLSEPLVRSWAAELLVALETLHRWGVVCKDLHPGNILLDDKGHLLLTFQAQWKGVDSVVSEESILGFYSAPENLSVFSITPAADWWSFGALLYRLLTGKALSLGNPDGIFCHANLSFPEYLSPESSSLLKELLKHEPGERLGSGINGAEEIKCHPFFNSVDWQLVYDNS